MPGSLIRYDHLTFRPCYRFGTIFTGSGFADLILKKPDPDSDSALIYLFNFEEKTLSKQICNTAFRPPKKN